MGRGDNCRSDTEHCRDTVSIYMQHSTGLICVSFGPSRLIKGAYLIQEKPTVNFNQLANKALNALNIMSVDSTSNENINTK